MSNISTQLLFEIAANTAQFKTALDDANQKLGGFGESFNKLKQIAIGAFEFEAIKEATQKLFAFSQEIGEATDKVQEFSDLSGKSLRDVTASIKASSDTFGQDFNEVLKTTNELSRQTGVSFKDASDLIQKGLALNHTNGAQFLALMQQFTPALHDAGLSGSESIALITNSLKQGIGEDGVTAILKASKNLTDLKQPAAEALAAIGISGEGLQEQITKGSITTFQAIQEIANRLKQLPPQSQEVGAVIDDVFGKTARKAGLSFIDSLGTMKTDMNDLIGQMSESEQAQLKLVQANQDLDDVWESMFGGSAVGWTNLKSELTEIAVNALVWIRDNTIEIINYFISLYNNSVLFRAIIQDLVLTFKTMWDAVKLVGGLLIDTFVNAGRIIKDVFTLNFKDIVPAYEDAIKKVVDRTVDFGKDVVNNFKEGVDATLNNKPIALIDLNKAEQQGSDAGKAFTKGFSNSMGEDDSTKKGEKGGKDKKFDIPKYSDGIQAIKSNIASKLAADFLKLKPVIDGATKSVKVLETESQKFGDSFTKSLEEKAYPAAQQLGVTLGQMATDGKSSFADLANAAENAAKSQVETALNTALANTIAANADLPFPADVVAIALGTAAIEAAFNSLPGFAAGGNVGDSPLQMVGEQGAELVSLPRNSYVHNNSDTNKMLSGIGSGGMNIAITSFGVKNDHVWFAVQEAQRKRNNSIGK